MIVSKSTSETGREAGITSGVRRQPTSSKEQPEEHHHEEMKEDGQERIITSERSASPEASRYSTDVLGREFGISSATIEHVRSIMEYGTPEQIQSARDRSLSGQKPGVRTMYEQVQILLDFPEPRERARARYIPRSCRQVRYGAMQALI